MTKILHLLKTGPRKVLKNLLQGQIFSENSQKVAAQSLWLLNREYPSSRPSAAMKGSESSLRPLDFACIPPSNLRFVANPITVE
jgi:hypothetical protein